MTRRFAAALMLATCVTGQAGSKVLVRCIDGRARPVEGAEVWVWQSRQTPDGGAELIGKGPFSSGANGSAKTVIAMTNAGGSFDRWVYARVAGKLVGASRVANFSVAKETDPITVKLLPSREIRGKISVPDGADPRKITVRTLGLTGAIDDNWWAQPFPRQGSIASLSNTLPNLFDAKVAADGTFLLRDMPKKALLYLAAEGEGLGQAQWFNALRKGRDIPELVEIALHPEATVTGIVHGPNERPLANTSVALQRLEGGVQVTWAATTGTEGRYRFVGLPEGEHRLKVTTPVGVMRPVNLSLKRGKAADGQDLVVERGVLVSGVVSNVEGQPTEGVGIAVLDPDPWGNRIYLGYGLTDPQGRFEVRLPSGPAQIYFNRVPTGYAYPKPQVVAEIDVAAGDASLRALKLVVPRAK